MAETIAPAAAPAASAPAPAAAPAPVAAAPVVETPTLASAIKGAFGALRDRAAVATELAAAKQTISTLTTERDAARADVAGLNTQISTLNTQLAAANSQVSTFAAFFGVKADEITGKSTDDLRSVLTQKVSAQAAELLAGQGVPQANLPQHTADTPTNRATKDAELVRQFNALPTAEERAAFYKQHFDTASGKN
jgi:hypothetical protein